MHFCARIHDHGPMLGLIMCSEHKPFFTIHTTSGPCKSRKSRRSGRFTRSTLSRSLPELPHFMRLHSCSQGQVEQVVPFQMMTKLGVMSTQLAKRNEPPDTISPNVADS